MRGQRVSILVCFDEAGNTSQHLVDPNQPVFTTAGVAPSEEHLGQIRDVLEWRPDEELHFAVLRRSRSGRRRILALCESELAVATIVLAIRADAQAPGLAENIAKLVPWARRSRGFSCRRSNGIVWKNRVRAGLGSWPRPPL